MNTDLEKLNELIRLEEANETKANFLEATVVEGLPDLYINESDGVKSAAMSGEFERDLLLDLKELEVVSSRLADKKEQIKSFLESNKLGSFSGTLLSVTYNSATTTTSIDTLRLKRELPDIAATYSKVSPRSSSISIKEIK